MCGIVAVLQRPSEREPASATEVLDILRAAVSSWPSTADPTALIAVATDVESADRLLRGVPGVRTLLADPGAHDQIKALVRQLEDGARALESDLDHGHAADHVEAVNAALIRVRDGLWAIGRDRLDHAAAVARILGDRPSHPAAVAALRAVEIAMASIDRLEVRGRDSAGVQVLVTGHGLDLTAEDMQRALQGRVDDALYTSMAVRVLPDGGLSFVYKAAAEIGELGDNVESLRAAVTGDDLFHRAIAADGSQVTVVGHTRWASVGIISQPNAHPLNSEEPDAVRPFVVAALNGDVDNHDELRESDDLRIPPEITTDAKVIPVLIGRRIDEGDELTDAFRTTVDRFEGSVAIAAVSSTDPDRVLLALRGSGQSLNIGLADDAYVVASEVYGLVEEAPRYVRMDGETPGVSGLNGQIVVLDRRAAGTAQGIARIGYDGEAVAVTDADVRTAEVTTRDIDRRGFRHFLLKEITEAPDSFRKTLRGKVIDGASGPEVHLGNEALPAHVRDRLTSGSIRRIIALGQGTAAVAAQSAAAALVSAIGPRLLITATTATELSGFELSDDMSDTLLVAISQSGTTTDTNRTVDLARGRGAAVIAIVNRRNSDLVDKADGVIYTSDGRDVEMAVPSTKAFYGQVAAGFILAQGIGGLLGTVPAGEAAEILTALRQLPDAMQQVLDRRESIADAAGRYGPPRRSWALVGNGPNRVAAAELRIKLSELCYKSIACDVTEDKKHIDLSAEPMILVCAAGLDGATADDVAKEVAIYRAHKAAPIVIATDGEERFSAALATIQVPGVHPALDFVLAAMAGHVFGYEAALAIDAQANVFRRARAAVEAASSAGGDLLATLGPELAPLAAQFYADLRNGSYNGHLEASTAVRVSGLLRYATGAIPLDLFELEHGKLGSPETVVTDLTEALTEAIDELTRPIDAIKHQAKTVTVGISRSEDALLEAPLVVAALAAGAARDQISYRGLRALAALGPAVAETTGYTRYRVEGDVVAGTATVEVVDQGGSAAGLRSRTDTDPRLRGTKRRALDEREVTVAVGRSDGRQVLLIPEVKANQPVALTLLHIRTKDRLSPSEAREVLRGYRGRYQALVDAVTETEPSFDDAVLGSLPIIALLTEPVNVLAGHWRS